MLEYLSTRRGFGYNGGILSPDCTKFILNIPKNSSSFMVDWAHRHNWTTAVVYDNCDWHRVTEVIVILRDPVERWISGITQYLVSYVLNGNNKLLTAEEFISQYNPVIENLIFDVVDRFDDHVWPQVEILQDVLPDAERKYFLLDQHFTKKIGSYLSFDTFKDLDVHSTHEDPTKQTIYNFFKKLLESRNDLKQKVIDVYAKDYELINKVTFQ